MIQRIQSIYLFLAAIALAGPAFVPLATASGDPALLATTGDNYFADGFFWFKELRGGIGLLLAAVIPIYAIFLYKNRIGQMRLARALALLAFLLTALFVGFGYYYAQRLPDGTVAHLALGSAFTPLAIPLLWLAYRAIKQDEELVRSSDRLR